MSGNSTTPCLPTPPPDPGERFVNQWGIPQCVGPGDQPPFWRYWYDENGIAHACFSGIIEATNIPPEC